MTPDHHNHDDCHERLDRQDRELAQLKIQNLDLLEKLARQVALTHHYMQGGSDGSI